MDIKKHKHFLKLPEYPGGKEEFKKFIKENLKYPEEAILNKVEGIVYLNAEIDDRGDVKNINIEKGIGYGCDNEAVRLLGLLQFGGVKNRGVRLKTRKKFRISFKLPQKKEKSIRYNLKKESQQKPTPQNKSNSYSYTINLNKE